MKMFIVLVVFNCLSGAAQAHTTPPTVSDVTFYSYCFGNRAFNLDEKNLSTLKDDCESKNLTCYEQESQFSTGRVIMASCLDLKK